MKMIEFNHIWKKFKKGERFNSLRDAVPNFFRRIVSRNKNNGFLDNRDFWALKDVSFEVKKADVLGIIGPNGAGKSTILKLLSRIMVPNKGNIAIDGRISALIEITAGFHDDLTGRENIYLNGTILGMRKREIDRKFDEIVGFSGFPEFIDTPVKRYSSGMRARLGFSVAAHMDPDILLVDEVLAVGDMAFQAKCANKMRELLNSRTTIVLVSHNLSLIQSLCKRVILLNKGEILREGAVQDVIPYYQNIVYEKREDELRRKIASSDYKVRINKERSVKISNVSLHNGKYKHKENFKIGELISIRVNYESKEKIENPIFSLDIIRADGVVCVSSNTKDDNFPITAIEGNGSIDIDLGKINLAPGIYLAKISVWDRDMIHTYTIRKNDILKIETAGFGNNINAVFLPKVEWNICNDSDENVYSQNV